MPTNYRDLLSLFLDKQSDVVVIGLQEVVMTGVGSRLKKLFNNVDIHQ
jgi:hypothetical protein